MLLQQSVSINRTILGLLMKTLSLSAILLVTASLVACGGGGGGTTAVIPTYSADAATTKLLAAGGTFTATAVSGSDTYTLSLSTTPDADATFGGTTRKKSTQSLTIKKNGVLAGVSTYDSYYSVNPLVSYGAVFSDGTYGVSTGSYVTPTAAKVGDSGAAGTQVIYTNSTLASILSTQTSTWTMEADTATTAFYCLNSVIKNASNIQTSTGSTCFKIDSGNNAIGLRITITVSGTTLVFS